MASAHPRSDHRGSSTPSRRPDNLLDAAAFLDHHGSPAPTARPTDLLDADALREENKQLRELVIQLSKLVIKNVVDRR